MCGTSCLDQEQWPQHADSIFDFFILFFVRTAVRTESRILEPKICRKVAPVVAASSEPDLTPRGVGVVCDPLCHSIW